MIALLILVASRIKCVYIFLEKKRHGGKRRRDSPQRHSARTGGCLLQDYVIRRRTLSFWWMGSILEQGYNLFQFLLSYFSLESLSVRHTIESKWQVRFQLKICWQSKRPRKKPLPRYAQSSCNSLTTAANVRSTL